MKKVAIQGILGSYHEIAAHAFFEKEEIELICCTTFKEVFSQIEKDPEVIGVIAIENTIAGSLLPNYTLLRNSNLTIVGEYKLRIEHNLVALKGQKIDDLKEVHSHPMALMQCEEYLGKHQNLKAVEDADTASSAKNIRDQQLFGHAAICSLSAAKEYDLEVLAEGIETNKHNFTRFLIVATPEKTKELLKDKKVNKSSLVFTLPHEEGSLSKVLSILSFYHINLTKIQSLPVLGREFEYLFYINLTFDDIDRYKQSLSAIHPLIKDLKVLGEYVEAPHNNQIRY